MKSYMVELTIAVFMDEMDDENSPESAAEIAENLVTEAISEYWNSQIITSVTMAEEIPADTSFEDAVTAYVLMTQRS